MIADKALHRIQTGDATPKEARKAIRDIIGRRGQQASAPLYAALRGWTWKTLQTRRFDEDMVEWFQVLRSARAALSQHDQVGAYYMEVLSDLVDDSIRYGGSHSRKQLLGRSHIGEILDIVRRNNGRIARARLETEAGLGSSRLSQLLTELLVAGAVEREVDGRKATFVLTDVGRELLDAWRDSRPVASTSESSGSQPVKWEAAPECFHPRRATADLVRPMSKELRAKADKQSFIPSGRVAPDAFDGLHFVPGGTVHLGDEANDSQPFDRKLIQFKRAEKKVAHVRG